MVNKKYLYTKKEKLKRLIHHQLVHIIYLELNYTIYSSV